MDSILTNATNLEMEEHYRIEFDVTSAHKKRQKNDMQPEFSYVHWLVEAPNSKYVTVNIDEYKNEPGRVGVGYVSYYNNMEKNSPVLERMKNDKNLKFLCINDLMDHEKESSKIAKQELDRFYLELYPQKSLAEI